MRLSGLSEIATQFDGMLIDQFGVIHDGQKLYPGAAEIMAKLHGLRIPVVIMTNSGKRAQASVERTVRLGIAREYFVDCMSSGEVAFQSLPRQRAFLVGRRDEAYGFDGVEFVDDPKDAEVMLILGSNAPETSLADYEEMFRGLTIPAVCCNPDKLMFVAGGFQPAPGAIADVYEQMGGTVRRIGKPFPEIYEFALRLLETSINDPSSRLRGNDDFNLRVLCIGDSPEHDVAGGRGARLKTLLVQQGVSAEMAEGDIHPWPDYILKDFGW
jgi:HAD superfamily hydrolase (TIGR01459 family)